LPKRAVPHKKMTKLKETLEEDIFKCAECDKPFKKEEGYLKPQCDCTSSSEET